MNTRQQLIRLLEEIGPENIWRPVYDEQGHLLADGHEDMRDGAPDDLKGIDFRTRSVLDMGCNLGFYSFLAKKEGAETVLGLDIDSQAVKVSRLLSTLYRMENIHFSCLDFTRFRQKQPYDLVLLINFIGKRSLVKGIQPVLDQCLRHAREAIVVSARSRYNIEHSLGVAPSWIARTYGDTYVRDGWFLTKEFLRDYLGGRLVQLSPDFEDPTVKQTFFVPVTAPCE